MHLWIQILFLAACICSIYSGDADCTFRAAVYESAFRLADPDPIRTMRSNLEVFETQAQLAAQQGAHIVVFPEMGITGLDWDSTQDLYYQQVPSLGTVPCLEVADSNLTMVVNLLSCAARQSSIYIVANFASISSCEDGSSCPERGSYHYNTDAAFDSNGTLIAVYHKLNLYGEPEFDAPPTTERVFFDAPFGRIGMLTCFDILWKEPTVTLAEEVDSIAFPTAWMDQLPYLASVQAQAAWAAGLNVNLLAANMHFPINGFMGSGLFAGLHGPVNYIYDSNVDGYLIVDDLPCHPKSSTNAKRSLQKPDADSIIDYHYIKYEDMSPFVGMTLSSSSTSALLCQDTLCCGANFQIVDDLDIAGHYALVVHRGNVSEGDLYTYAAEICSILWCVSKDLATCTKQPSNVTSAFTSLEIWGNFSTPYVYPSILTDQLQLALPDRWSYGNSNSCNGLASDGTCADLRILSGDSEDELRANAITLYGRLYDLDPKAI